MNKPHDVVRKMNWTALQYGPASRAKRLSAVRVRRPQDNCRRIGKDCTLFEVRSRAFQSISLSATSSSSAGATTLKFKAAAVAGPTMPSIFKPRVRR